MNNLIFNFSAGPAMLPTKVLNKVKQELCDWHNMGVSVMEISHRSKEFAQIIKTAEQDLRELLTIPENYKVLFCHGGARTQFSAVPLNLLREKRLNADYINSGYWSYNAAIEAKKYCQPCVINVSYKIDGLRAIKPMHDWKLSKNSVYLHYCPNETIDGLSIDELPDFGNRVVIGDFSSTLLSRPLNINRFGIIYASAQKNIGPAGLTLVIIREDLLGNACNKIPSTLNYQIISKNNSMFNTPPTFALYIAGQVFKWLKMEGGLKEINKRNEIKAKLLYNTIDEYDCFYNNISYNNRSFMNVTFRLKNDKLDELFLKKSLDIGLYALKGHIKAGGIRASLYNAMPLEGVQALVNFMKEFAYYHG